MRLAVCSIVPLPWHWGHTPGCSITPLPRAAASAKHAGKDVANPARAAAPGAALTPAPAFEHVGEIESAEVERNSLTVGTGLCAAGKSAATATASGLTCTRVGFGGCRVNVVGVIADLVVNFPLLGIAENVVGLGHALEPLFVHFFPRLYVRILLSPPLPTPLSHP